MPPNKFSVNENRPLKNREREKSTSPISPDTWAKLVRARGVVRNGFIPGRSMYQRPTVKTHSVMVISQPVDNFGNVM